MSSAPSRSSPDPLANALGAAVTAIAAAVVAVSAANPVVLIDGRSGAGKSSLARLLVGRWPHPGRVQLIELDWLYPGWEGMEAGVAYARSAILVPHGRGVVGVWQRWDWETGERAQAHAVDPSLPLILEGAGLLTADTAPLGDVRVWLEAPLSSRRRRGLDRDGDTYAPHWDRWAGQEDAHLARDRPERRADLVLAVP